MDRAVRFYSSTLGLKLADRFGNQWASVERGRGGKIGLSSNLGTNAARPEGDRDRCRTDWLDPGCEEGTGGEKLSGFKALPTKARPALLLTSKTPTEISFTSRNSTGATYSRARVNIRVRVLALGGSQQPAEVLRGRAAKLFHRLAPKFGQLASRMDNQGRLVSLAALGNRS